MKTLKSTYLEELTYCVVTAEGALLESSASWLDMMRIATAQSSLWSIVEPSENTYAQALEQHIANREPFELKLICRGRMAGRAFQVIGKPVDLQSETPKACLVWHEVKGGGEQEKVAEVLRAISERVEEGFYRTGADGTILYVNKALAEMFGYSDPAEMSELNTAHLYVDPSKREEFVMRLDRENQVTNQEVLLKKRNGSIFWGLLSASRNTDPTGKTVIDGALRDITRIKEIERQLKFETERAEAATLSKQQFLSTISHELRTPLNAVIGLIHLLIKDNPRPDQIDQMQSLLFSAENLLQLINDILDFSKLDAGKVELDPRPLKLLPFFTSLIESFKPQAEKKGIGLSLSVDERVPATLAVDSLRLGQILNNLISNAIKFTYHGSVAVRIDVKSVNTENDSVQLRFAVVDTGIGIPRSKLHAVFNAFTQASSSTTRRYGGTGLGLSITKNLIELHKGELNVDSEPGEGTEFSFIIDFKKAVLPSPEPLHAENASQEAKETSQLAGKKVLAVEDNEVNQMLIRKFLQNWGIEVSVASNGLEALEKTRTEQFDMILMDLQMPVMDGYTASRNIREVSPYYSDIPIVAVTASMESEIKDRCKEAGMDSILLKPYSPQSLKSALLRSIS
jgi:PAS domain S-box-containing protein